MVVNHNSVFPYLSIYSYPLGNKYSYNLFCFTHIQDQMGFTLYVERRSCSEEAKAFCFHHEILWKHIENLLIYLSLSIFSLHYSNSYYQIFSSTLQRTISSTAFENSYQYKPEQHSYLQPEKFQLSNSLSKPHKQRSLHFYLPLQPFLLSEYFPTNVQQTKHQPFPLQKHDSCSISQLLSRKFSISLLNLSFVRAIRSCISFCFFKRCRNLQLGFEILSFCARKGRNFCCRRNFENLFQ